jgi:hypothetical protein
MKNMSITRIQAAFEEVKVLYAKFDGYEIAEAIKLYRAEAQAIQAEQEIKNKIAELERQIKP